MKKDTIITQVAISVVKEYSQICEVSTHKEPNNKFIKKIKPNNITAATLHSDLAILSANAKHLITA